ncbi:hypothetical protein CF161_26359 [Pseudomonas sp. CF161]|nr:hypothetical protein CF161_26359 [Pseudomonas sp. CF161]
MLKELSIWPGKQHNRAFVALYLLVRSRSMAKEQFLALLILQMLNLHQQIPMVFPKWKPSRG